MEDVDAIERISCLRYINDRAEMAPSEKSEIAELTKNIATSNKQETEINIMWYLS